jgi:hypothetical protein
VLGSSQPPPELSESAQGLEVIRRASGGGAVLVAPDAQLWVNVWLPRGDALWVDDVVRSSQWLGEAFVSALRQLGVPDLAVHTGRLERTEWSDLICFAGLGPGEVSTAGKKLVGLAQRRDRYGARFHSFSSVSPVGPALTSVLALEASMSKAIEGMLDATTTCLEDVLGSAECRFLESGRTDNTDKTVEAIETVETVEELVASAIRDSGSALSGNTGCGDPAPEVRR